MTKQQCIHGDTQLLSNPPKWKCTQCGNTWFCKDEAPECPIKQQSGSGQDILVDGLRAIKESWEERFDEEYADDPALGIVSSALFHAKTKPNEDASYITEKLRKIIQEEVEKAREEERERMVEIVESKRLPLQPEIVSGANSIIDNYNAVLDEILKEIKERG